MIDQKLTFQHARINKSEAYKRKISCELEMSTDRKIAHGPKLLKLEMQQLSE